MRRKVKLVWNVLHLSWDKDEVKALNIFYDGFVDELKKDLKKREIKSYDDLKNYLNRWAHYHYWCKSECEMLVGSLFCKDVSELHKIDIYKQIEINLDNITDYVIKTLKIDFKAK